MFIDIFWLIFSLFLIIGGATILTDGSSSLARKMGVSELMVGLTVVAFGTSAPELVISMIASAENSAQLAVGNVVGSNIFNILAIVGITAMIHPIKIEKTILTKEIPMVILSALILLMLGNSSLLNSSPINQIDRVDAIFLILLFLIFIRYTPSSAKEGNVSEVPNSQKTLSTTKSIIYVIAGLIALIWGGDRFVNAAKEIALNLGMSEGVVGLTIVAAGTSLPELATSVVSAFKGHVNLAVGNVIGSNIFNTLLVLGAAGLINPLPFQSIGNLDLLWLLGATLLFFIFGWTFQKQRINRLEGTILTAGYVVYIVILLSRL